MKGKKDSITYTEARERLFKVIAPLEAENIDIKDCAGRIIAQDVLATGDVPPFDRSPYDGYAFRAEDTASASSEEPVTLKVVDYIPAGGVSRTDITEGCAARLMTGAPIPKGADCVTLYEVTEFTDEEVKIFSPSKAGDNIVRAGEDVKKGALLAQAGSRIDEGLAGTLASQNIAKPLVYKRVKVGLVSTGSELVEVGSSLTPGMIYDSNSHTLSAACEKYGFECIRYGICKDTIEEISCVLEKALSECDAVLLTGGASVGDFDVTPEAILNIGGELLFRGVKLKPGMACAFAIKDGKLIAGLSGNPASSLTTFHVVAVPALLKMAGVRDYIPQEFTVTLANDFNKKSKGGRVLRGKLDLTGGEIKLVVKKDQGNVVISSTIGCDCMAFVPVGSGPLPAGTKLPAIMM